MPISRRVIGGALAALALAGCGGKTPRTARPTAPPSPVLVPPPPGPELAPLPPLPPASLGPRAEFREPAPQPAPAPREPAPEAPIAPPVPPAQRGRFVVLNFESADVETVVHATSEILGFNYVLAPDVRGKVTVQTSGRIPHEDVFGVLLAILEVHGFTAVRSDNLYKIVRIPDAAARAVPTIVGTSVDPTRVGDEIVTQIVPLRYANVNDVRTLLQPLVSPQRGNLIAHRETNVLMITDTASNIRRLLDIVRLVDVEVSLDEVQIIRLQYADAVETAQILTQMFSSGRIRLAGAAPQPAPVPAPPPAPGAAAPGAAPAPAAPRPVEPVGERPPLILAERRSNSLIVYARRSELEAIRSLVSRLDVSITGGRRIFIYYAENAKAKDLAATMNSIYGREGEAGVTPRQPTAGARPGGSPSAPPPPPVAAPGTVESSFVEGQLRFIADETTNAVILATYPRVWSDIEFTLRQLDRSPRQVLIEVLVAEVTLKDDTRLGLEWALRSGNLDVSSAPGLGTNVAGVLQARPGYSIPPAAAKTVLAGFNAFTFATDRFFAALNAFAAQNLLNVLSSPSIITSENRKAVINVSQSIPIITSQQVPFGGTAAGQDQTTPQVIGTQTVEYRDAGVILTVTPRIGERGTVALDVKQEVNDVGEAVPPTNSPSIIKREAETSVVLLNNQTLVLGGLIRDRHGKTERGVPYLHKIPVLGYLFGAKVDTTDKTELLILITPRVIGTAADAARITDAYRRGSPQVEESLQKAIPLPPTSPGLTPAIPPSMEREEPAPPPPAPGQPAEPGPSRR